MRLRVHTVAVHVYTCSLRQTFTTSHVHTHPPSHHRILSCHTLIPSHHHITHSSPHTHSLTPSHTRGSQKSPGGEGQDGGSSDRCLGEGTDDSTKVSRLANLTPSQFKMWHTLQYWWILQCTVWALHTIQTIGCGFAPCMYHLTLSW